MKIHLPYFLALIIGLVSFQTIDARSLDFADRNELQTLTSVDAWDLNPLRESDTKASQKQKTYIAQDFIPIVTIAWVSFEQHNFQYYLPLYRLQREKDYFLLI